MPSALCWALVVYRLLGPVPLLLLQWGIQSLLSKTVGQWNAEGNLLCISKNLRQCHLPCPQKGKKYVPQWLLNFSCSHTYHCVRINLDHVNLTGFGNCSELREADFSVCLSGSAGMMLGSVSGLSLLLLWNYSPTLFPATTDAAFLLCHVLLPWCFCFDTSWP